MTYYGRTDLALEAAARVFSDEKAEHHGIRQDIRRSNGFTVTEVTVENDEGSSLLCKPIGRYVTVDVDRLLRREDGSFADCARCIAGELSDMLLLRRGETVLVAGLGNPGITPDAVGHEVLRRVLVTRHLAAELDFLRPVAAFETGVIGVTGIESGDMLKAAVRLTRPSAVIAVDALASASVQRLLKTVQLCDSGIAPGSGIGNSREALNAEALGVPVIAIGVPTVVDAATVAGETASRAGVELDTERLRRENDSLIVTPCDVDAKLRDICKAVSYGINLALHDGLTVEDVDALTV